MTKVKGKPITGTNTAMQAKPSIKTPDTSVQAERQIKQPPQPFQNKFGTVKTPAPSGPQGAVPGPVRKPHAGNQRTTVGAKALPSGGPVGYSKLPNQSKQIGGRFGTSRPRKVGKSPFYGD